MKYAEFEVKTMAHNPFKIGLDDVEDESSEQKVEFVRAFDWLWQIFVVCESERERGREGEREREIL